MFYLLAKYTLLFLLSVVLGVLLGRWWIRRSYVDVTERYSELAESQQTTDSGWNKLWQRLDLLDGGIEPKIHTALAQLPGQPPVDLSGIEQRLERLERRLSKPPAQDFSTIVQRLDTVETSLTDTLHQALERAADDRSSTRTATAEQAPASRDLSAIGERIADLERYVRTLPRSSHQLDLSPIKLRLGAIEVALQALAGAGTAAAASGAESRTAEPAPSSNPAKEAATGPGPQLFSSPEAGTRDNLKRISGVGPKLESLLNDNGVYYFWQIASWSPSDVEFMDERLDVFKGRIKRDNWVAQATELQKETGAAKQS